MERKSAWAVGKRRTLTGAVSLLPLLWSASALAQDAAAAQPQPPAQPQAQAYVDNGDIIVTARKRQESILKVPVVVTAVSEEKLSSVGITQVTELPKLVPGLVISGNLLSIGPQVTIRGVGTSSYDPGVDQSVSLNIDGLSLGQGLAFGSGMFDVAQVEVLKGPQSLFFGKSTPGGVISLRTADPGDDYEVIARGSYEIEAREWRGELIASGPVTETLGARIATSYSRGDGYFYNRAVPEPGTGAAAPNKRDPRPRNFMLRGTLLWKPIDNFSARLKVNHAYDHFTNSELSQLANCPDGPGQSFSPAPGILPSIPFIGGDDCKLDRDLHIVYLDPAAFPGVTNKGVPYLTNKQNYGTLELNYDLMPSLSLSSTTAYYKLNSSSLVNPTHTTAAGPTFAVTNRFSRREFTEELRLNSDFSGPLNFTAGAFYEDGRLYDRVHFIRNTAYAFLAAFPPNVLNDDRATTVDIKTYSAFGQLRYKITDQVELAGGVRYTDETRREHVFDHYYNEDITPYLPRPKVHSSTWSPEATITYTPTDDLTVFASYKKGFKSGSFKVAVPANVARDPATGAILPGSGENNAFDDEKVKGYEIGLKSRLLDHSLLFNLAFYDYRYDGLQVGGIEPPPGGFGSPIINTVNAGKARSYGVDLDLTYRPPAIEGLTLNGSLNWNHARYKDLTRIGCYYNQLFQEGCSVVRVEDGATLHSQQLSGTPMIRAPEWAANFGFNYEMPVGSGLKLQLSNNNQYSDSYVTYPAVGRPDNDNIQRSYFKIDASIALKDENDRWEVALLGKNLTDKIIASNCSATNFAGGILLPFGGDNAGGTTRGAGGYAENGCFADGPGRAVMIRLTLRPLN
jgi:iron complex outermembrane receptor protein